MKKITFTLAVMLALHSCKKEAPATPLAEPQTEELERSAVATEDVVTPVSPVLNPDAVLPPDFYETSDLYDGAGVITSGGEMNYNILMPVLKTGSYSFVKFYNLGNNILFMQMQDPDFEPTSKNSVYTLREDVLPLGFNLNQDISVFLYFENGNPVTLSEARRVYAKGCNSLSEPKKCGTGIVKLAK